MVLEGRGETVITAVSKTAFPSSNLGVPAISHSIFSLGGAALIKRKSPLF